MVRPVLLFLIALCIGPFAAGAQTPTCGWHFLDQPEVPPVLQQLRARASEAPEWLPEAETQLLQWYRSCDHAAARTAARTLEAIRKRSNSSDPLLLSWLGIALVRGPDVQVEHAEGAVLRSVHESSNAARDGARLLAQVVERGGWPEVAEELAAVAVATRREETVRLASKALWAIADTRTEPAFWSALAELELVNGDSAAAEKAAARAVALGAARGMRAAGILRMLKDRDATPGATLYLGGLQAATGATDVQFFFDDLRLLLDSVELAGWRSLQTGRAEWIRRRWEWRARLSDVQLAERLGVNVRRLDHALKNYGRTSFPEAAPLSAIMTTSQPARLQPLDDRAMLYLRHGAPASVIRMPRANRIAWLYRGGPIASVFEFDRMGAHPEYFLAEPHPVCGGQHVLRTDLDGAPDRSARGYPNAGDRVHWAGELIGYDPGLASYYTRCAHSPSTAGTSFALALSRALRNAEAAWHSESGVTALRERLPMATTLYTFHTSAGPELVSYLSLEAATIKAVSPGAYRLAILVSVGDPVTEQLIQHDTVLAYSTTGPLPPDAVIHTAVAMKATAQEHARVTIVVRNAADPGQGQVSSTTWRAPAFDGTLLLSDIVIADTRNGVLRRGEHQLAPVPGHAVYGNTPFRLFWELYGASAGDPLAVAITIMPGRDESLRAQLQSLISSRSALSVEFQEEARPDATGAMRVARDVTADLQPGAYSLVVTVRNTRTNQTARAETTIVVGERP